MTRFDEEKMLEKLREKLGPTKKVDERAELERLFGKKEKTREEILMEKMGRPTLAPGDLIDLHITGLAFGGRGIGRHIEKPVFVDDCVPGDSVKVQITKAARDHFFGKKIELITGSSDRIPARCPYFDACGGCQIQCLSYTAQLKCKHAMVVDVLQNIGNLKVRVNPVIPSPETFGYRLRARFKLDSTGRESAIGFFSRKSNTLVPIDKCEILAPIINRIFPQLPSLLPSPGTAPLPDEIILHTDIECKAVVIHLNSNQPLLYLNELLKQCHQRELPITGISNSGQHGFRSAGDTTVTHTVSSNDFQVSGHGFFQVNRFLLKTLLDQVRMLASPSLKDKVLDLYSGVGFLSIPMARFVESVFGVDSDKSAVALAAENAAAAAAGNAEFEASRDQSFFKLNAIKSGEFNMMIVDPPRAGLHNHVRDALIRRKPPKLLYVSCDPSTLARDLKALVAADFRVRVIQPIDLFPHTYHIENLVYLTHRYTGTQAATEAFVNLN